MPSQASNGYHSARGRRLHPTFLWDANRPGGHAGVAPSFGQVASHLPMGQDREQAATTDDVADE
ncbi:hypothetical protein, partial [Sphingobium yanoikuyae]|uniref:hypothetical protein n=1 Tax=Sphingobium yanoikuyae TaxID=13690 RepID=UPI0028B1053F